MQHLRKAATAEVINLPQPRVDPPTGGPEAQTSLQVEQEQKSRRGRPLSRIRDEKPPGASDSRGEVAWNTDSRSSDDAGLGDEETLQESMQQRAASSIQGRATATLPTAPHAGADRDGAARGMEVTPADAAPDQNMTGVTNMNVFLARADASSRAR